MSEKVYCKAYRFAHAVEHIYSGFGMQHSSMTRFLRRNYFTFAIYNGSFYMSTCEGWLSVITYNKARLAQHDRPKK